MIEGCGDDLYRQGLADWMCDPWMRPGPADLRRRAGAARSGSAVTEARAAALPDPRQSALESKIAEIPGAATASRI